MEEASRFTVGRVEGRVRKPSQLSKKRHVGSFGAVFLTADVLRTSRAMPVPSGDEDPARVTTAVTAELELEVVLVRDGIAAHGGLLPLIRKSPPTGLGCR